MLFLGGLADSKDLVIVCSSFAHSSLIVRSSFAQGSNRKFFCLGIDKNFVRLTYCLIIKWQKESSMIFSIRYELFNS